MCIYVMYVCCFIIILSYSSYEFCEKSDSVFAFFEVASAKISTPDYLSKGTNITNENMNRSIDIISKDTKKENISYQDQFLGIFLSLLTAIGIQIYLSVNNLYQKQKSTYRSLESVQIEINDIMNGLGESQEQEDPYSKNVYMIDAYLSLLNSGLILDLKKNSQYTLELLYGNIKIHNELVNRVNYLDDEFILKGSDISVKYTLSYKVLSKYLKELGENEKKMRLQIEYCLPLVDEEKRSRRLYVLFRR